MDSILSIENLKAGYDNKVVLTGVNLSLARGEICCVIGEEGSGKSTFLKAVVQQIKNTGKLTYDARNLNIIPTSEMIKNSVDFIVQGGNILKGFTVEEHICLALSEKDNERKRIIWDEIYEIFPKIATLKKQIGGRLSGGERMILSMACILATDADLLLLDEPTAGLSPEVCDDISVFLKKMKNERNKTILLFEHNFEFAFKISDSVLILKEGKLSRKFDPIAFNHNEFINKRLYENAIHS